MNDFTLATQRVRKLRFLANLSWIPFVGIFALGLVAWLFPPVGHLLDSTLGKAASVVALLLFVPSVVAQLAFNLGFVRCPNCGQAFEAYNAAHVFSYCRHCMFNVFKPELRP
jgi:hypothetical protein